MKAKECILGRLWHPCWRSMYVIMNTYELLLMIHVLSQTDFFFILNVNFFTLFHIVVSLMAVLLLYFNGSPKNESNKHWFIDEKVIALAFFFFVALRSLKSFVCFLIYIYLFICVFVCLLVFMITNEIESIKISQIIARYIDCKA